MTLRLNGSTSGFTEIDAPAVAGSNTLVLPTGAGSAYQVVRNGATAGSLEFTDKIVSGTAVASTSGTSIDFTGIPSWVKRVTVMFNGVSINGTSHLLIQIGTSGGIQTTSYASNSSYGGPTGGGTSSTAGFVVFYDNSSRTYSGQIILSLLNSGTGLWVESGIFAMVDVSGYVAICAGAKTLSGTLDRVRITSGNGTDTFDAGSINLLWE